MPMPSRHFAVNGFPFLLVWKLTGLWWVGVLGGIASFLGHTPIDLLFNEHWERTRSDDVLMAIEQISVAYFLIWLLGPVYGVWWVVLFYLLASLQDLIDLVMWSICWVKKINLRELFPNHPSYKKWASFLPDHPWEPWFAQESMALTVTLEVLLPGLAIVITHWIYGKVG